MLAGANLSSLFEMAGIGEFLSGLVALFTGFRNNPIAVLCQGLNWNVTLQRIDRTSRVLSKFSNQIVSDTTRYAGYLMQVTTIYVGPDQSRLCQGYLKLDCKLCWVQGLNSTMNASIAAG
jgi:hypothetical protein